MKGHLCCLRNGFLLAMLISIVSCSANKQDTELSTLVVSLESFPFSEEIISVDISYKSTASWTINGWKEILQNDFSPADVTTSFKYKNEPIVVDTLLLNDIISLADSLFISCIVPVCLFQQPQDSPAIEYCEGYDICVNVNKKVGKQMNENHSWRMYDGLYDKGTAKTGDNEILYSLQFKRLVQCLDFICTQAEGGREFENYLEFLRNCEKDSTREVLIYH
jgi:hypothetical protein